MKRSFWIAAAIVLLPLSGTLGQDPSPPPGEGVFPERIERYKKVRLLEVLDLREDVAVRFMARYNKHQETMRENLRNRMRLIDALEEALKAGASDSVLAATMSAISDLDRHMFEERDRFHRELPSILTMQQVARFVTFDRNFHREVRRAMEEVRRERRRR